MSKVARAFDSPIQKLRDAISEQNRQVIRIRDNGGPVDVVVTAQAISIVMNEVVAELREILGGNS